MTALPENRYLRDASGALVGARGLLTVITFAPVMLAALLVVAAIVTSGGTRVACGAAALVCFLVGPAIMWARIFSGSTALEKATAAWRSGDRTTVVTNAHRVLATVFRADMRTRAFHLLGLAAEQAGDFAEAFELFNRAEEAIPSMAAPMRKRDATVLMDAHRGLALIALGRAGEAGSFIGRAFQNIGQTGRAGVLDALTDDADWGVGAVSMNDALVKIEGGRPARAIVSLAAAFHNVANGALPQAQALLVAEHPTFMRGLLPYELALATRLHAISSGAPPVADPADGPWVAACLRGLGPR